jgi:hypothetical protein
VRVAGSNVDPRPATGITALRIRDLAASIVMRRLHWLSEKHALAWSRVGRGNA